MAHGGYMRRARCQGHASAVLHVDWSADSAVVRTGSTSREVLHHQAGAYTYNFFSST